MKDWAELIRAIADLLGVILWPIVVLLVVSVFKPELRKTVHQLKRLKLGAAEIEFDRQLDELEDSAQHVEATVVPATVAVTGGEVVASDSAVVSANETMTIDRQPARFDEESSVREILRQTAYSPKVGLILLGVQIDRELAMHVPYLTDRPQTTRHPSYIETLERLAANGRISGYVFALAQQFRDVRNKIIHGANMDPDDILRAVDSGIVLLRALQAIPRETNVVRHNGAEVFADPAGLRLRENVLAIVLETTSHDGKKSQRVFPVKRRDYRIGEPVTWEWDMSDVIGESWYRHPESKQIEYAWKEAAIFAGKHPEEVWR